MSLILKRTKLVKLYHLSLFLNLKFVLQNVTYHMYRDILFSYVLNILLTTKLFTVQHLRQCQLIVKI